MTKWGLLPLSGPLMAVLVVTGFILLIILIRARRAVGTAAVSASGGLAALAVVNLTGLITGVTLPLNLFSVLVCLILGAPGIISLLVLQLFW